MQHATRYPYINQEGYIDPTAGKALSRIEKERKEVRKPIFKLTWRANA